MAAGVRGALRGALRGGRKWSAGAASKRRSSIPKGKGDAGPIYRIRLGGEEKKTGEGGGGKKRYMRYFLFKQGKVSVWGDQRHPLEESLGSCWKTTEAGKAAQLGGAGGLCGDRCPRSGVCEGTRPVVGYMCLMV